MPVPTEACASVPTQFFVRIRVRMFEPHFVALMQIYLTSHAIHQTKDAALVASIRHAYADINNRYNATIVVGETAENPNALNIYEDTLRQNILDASSTEAADRVWDAVGFLGDLSAREVSARTHDDRVMRYCFAAQVIYTTQVSEVDKDQIAMSVMRGKVSSDLRSELRQYVSAIVAGLRSCPDYEFRVYWGFPEMMHRMYIAEPGRCAEFGYNPFALHTAQDACKA
jgi:hypothetical protein